LDFNALMLVMVSKRNLFVKRTGVSLMATIDDDAGDDNAMLCFRAAAVVVPAAVVVAAADAGNKHLLYIDAVGRLNGIILHR
jgi:hypothetical protein